jgi:hypothetical protein
MSEWWTYSLSDFLLFSPRTYYRLFELYNLAIWPTQLAALALGATILGMLRTSAAWQGRIIMAVLALVWLWVAWAYFLERYETINWAATYFAAGFAVEAALLVCVGGFRQVSFRLSQNASRAGLAISAFAMFLYPLIAPALGRPWTQSETFGITPDPTAIATLGILLVERGRFRWGLSVVPLTWCAITTATLWAMDSFDALVPVLASCLVVLIAMRKSEAKPDRKEALEHHLEPRAASARGASPSAEG